MSAPKGTRPPGGSRKGKPNKTTRAAREAFQYAFDKMGGADELAAWAQLNKTEFYKLFSRLIPVQVQGDSDAPIVTKIIICGPDD